VLEHVAWPANMVADMVAATGRGGLLYVELPDQPWREPWMPRIGMEAWMRFLCRHPRALLAADIYSTAFRVKAGMLPPYGFVPMREHLNFYTPDSLAALASRFALDALYCQKDSQGSLVLVGRKR
jgi:hypothetical protein